MHLDWGNVPSWLAAGSLLLAFRIFLRDRSNNVRSQVDKLGVWLDISTDSNLKSQASVTWHFHNSSDSPVRIVQWAARIDTIWQVKPSDEPPDDDDGIEVPGAGIGTDSDENEFWRLSTGKRFKEMWEELEPALVIPPNTSSEYIMYVTLTDMRPKRAIELYWWPVAIGRPVVHRGLSAKTLWCLVIDNAGRRWEISPGGTGLAKYVGMLSKRRGEYPVSWQRRFGRVPAKVILRMRSIGLQLRRVWVRGKPVKVSGGQWPGEGWRTVPYQVWTTSKKPIGRFRN